MTTRPPLKSLLSRLFWLIPFACFLSGYWVLDLFLHHSYLKTPHVLGRSLPEALEIISSKNLNVRLLSYKEDDHLKEGTVISQNPSAESFIRPQQTVFLKASCKQKQATSPTYIGKKYESIISELKDQNIPPTIYYVQSNHPKGTCIAQIPEPGDKALSRPLVLYISDNTKDHSVLVPSFTGKSVQEVETFLKDNNLKSALFHGHPVEPDHACTTCSISHQKPLAGSFITLDSLQTIQLKVND